MFSIKNLNLNFTNQIIFDDISFQMQSKQKIGLVGRNGSGKTTLLKIIAGLQKVNSGDIQLQKDCKIAYMPQELILLSKRNILNEATTAFDGFSYLIDEVNELEKFFDGDYEKDLKKTERYTFIQSKLHEFEYEKKLVEAKNILFDLGFSEKQLDQKVNELSVGWKMRLVLAKLLLQNADFYLFDEPTNHLDIITKDWFLNFLKNSSFGFLLVCHDKYFLDHLCGVIFELSFGKLNIYKGNYSYYLQQKEKNELLLEKKFLEQQKFLKKEQKVIDRFRASATKAKMVQSKLKALEKIDFVQLDCKQKTVRFRLENILRSGKTVLTVKKLSKFFERKKVFANISFQIERGDKVAIVAPNGKGKSTLLSIIIGKLVKDLGEIEFGCNVLPAFFEQDQNKSLNLENTIYEEVESCCNTTEKRQKIRSYLGAFLFSGDDVEKKIKVLSGGEKNRVAMVKVLLKGANFLLLDEPTNHLDIESKDVLLKVLKKFKGTIIFVSHDRDFLNHLATSIIELKENSAYKYKGNYDSFLFQKQDSDKCLDHQFEIKKEKKNTIKMGKQEFEKRKKIRSLELKIEKLEKELAYTSNDLSKLEYGTDKYYQAFDIIKKIEKDLNENMQLWEELHV